MAVPQLCLSQMLQDSMATHYAGSLNQYRYAILQP